MPSDETLVMNRTRLLASLAALSLSALSGSAAAAPPLSYEPTDLRAGQKVRVDDGTCPNGHVKEVVGSAVRQNNGTVIIKRIRNCVRR